MTKNIDTSYEQSAMAVVVCHGKLLCTVENIYGKDVLSLPKGHVEEGETAIDTAIRECFEETDVTLTPNDVTRQLEPYNYGFTTPSGKNICKSILPVLFTIDNERIPCAKEHRISKVCYMPIEDFLRNCTYDNVRQLVKNLFAV